MGLVSTRSSLLMAYCRRNYWGFVGRIWMIVHYPMARDDRYMGEFHLMDIPNKVDWSFSTMGIAYRECRSLGLAKQMEELDMVHRSKTLGCPAQRCRMSHMCVPSHPWAWFQVGL